MGRLARLPARGLAHSDDAGARERRDPVTEPARRAARQDAAGGLVPLEAQDRGLWDVGQAREGLSTLDRALAMGAPGPFQIKAAISALHVQAENWAETDWRQMLFLYDALLRHEPSDVVRLNRLAVQAELGGVDCALKEVEALAPTLDGYQPFHALRADLLARSGRPEDAAAAYGRAIALSQNRAERDFLDRRRAKLLGTEKSRAKGPAKSNREV